MPTLGGCVLAWSVGVGVGVGLLILDVSHTCVFSSAMQL
jgi:hypothetical protein